MFEFLESFHGLRHLCALRRHETILEKTHCRPEDEIYEGLDEPALLLWQDRIPASNAALQMAMPLLLLC